MNYEQSKNIVNITQSSCSPYHITPPIINHRSCDELETFIPVTWNTCTKHICKVEFNQPSCWLYSVPNLFVFQHLVTPYLGRFVVRVVSEIECWMFKSVQENRVSRLDLAGDSRLQAARCSTRAKHARRWTVMLTGALQDKIGQLAIRLSSDWISQLSQVARPNREPALFWKTWRFTFSSHLSINTPYTHKWERASRENFERETLE